MNNLKGLENILRAELILLSKQILQNTQKGDFKELYRQVKKLHEKMAAIKVLSEQMTDDELKNFLFKAKEETTVITENVTTEDAKIPEDLQKKITPKTSLQEETIEKTPKKVLDNVYKKAANISFTKKEKKVEEPKNLSVENIETSKQEQMIEKIANPPVEKAIPTSNKTKNISIGLNDRIAFINNLFAGNAEHYNETINKLNQFNTYEAALKYIYSDVKPKYNNWEEKDVYEFRLLQLLELKYN